MQRSTTTGGRNPVLAGLLALGVVAVAATAGDRALGQESEARNQGATQQLMTQEPEARATDEKPGSDDGQAQDSGAAGTEQAAKDEPAGTGGQKDAPKAGMEAPPEGSGGVAEQQPAKEQPGAGSGGFIPVQDTDQLLTGELIGEPVSNGAGEEIGTLNGFVLDRQGQVDAVLIGVGGFLGLGEKEVAIAWPDVTIQPGETPGEGAIVVDFGREMLENAPGYRTVEDVMNEKVAAQMQEEARKQQEQMELQSQQPATASE